ncbi:MAG: hypothetical protein ACR2NP_21265 [Pirellulaceae bacterium]
MMNGVLRIHRLRLLIAWLLMIFLPGTAWCQETEPDQQFVIYLWGTPDIADPGVRAQAIADAGFNVADWDASDLERLERASFKAMIHGATPELALQLKDHWTVWGYHCRDEPWPESEFAPLAEQIEALRQADPNHPCFVNMLSTTGEFLRTYMDVVEPEILSFDYYQWWWGSDRYFEKLEQFRDAARLAGVPLGSCIEVNANPAIESGPAEYLPDNAVRLRQSVYTNLAYGVTVFEWFYAKHMYQPGSYERTPAGRDVTVLNRELQWMGGVMAGLKSVDVFHSTSQFAGTRTIPRDHWVQVSGEAGRAPIVLGMFVDEQGMDYLVLVNCDCDHAQTATVELQSKWLGIAPWNEPKQFEYHVEAFERSWRRSWQAVETSSSTSFSRVIPPGDGVLFRIRTEFEP